MQSGVGLVSVINNNNNFLNPNGSINNVGTLLELTDAPIGDLTNDSNHFNKY